MSLSSLSAFVSSALAAPFPFFPCLCHSRIAWLSWLLTAMAVLHVHTKSQLVPSGFSIVRNFANLCISKAPKNPPSYAHPFFPDLELHNENMNVQFMSCSFPLNLSDRANVPNYPKLPLTTWVVVLLLLHLNHIFYFVFMLQTNIVNELEKKTECFPGQPF